ncbi:hypothetical protein [Pseudoxanthomonas koreensis]|uniref:hypothetical protein n=1 Tax=Pseudoxanthomonas koreensis TaxID=266061 RepID=UPI0013916E92|nr:hypothetical protein [Pseudoxanthomonas koreensis]
MNITITRPSVSAHLLVLAAVVAVRAVQTANPPNPALIDAVTRLVNLATEAMDREVTA